MCGILPGKNEDEKEKFWYFLRYLKLFYPYIDDYKPKNHILSKIANFFDFLMRFQTHKDKTISSFLIMSRILDGFLRKPQSFPKMVALQRPVSNLVVGHLPLSGVTSLNQPFWFRSTIFNFELRTPSGVLNFKKSNKIPN